MLQAYWSEGLEDRAAFSLFFRRLPSARSYLVACGLDDVFRYLEELHFSGEALEYLRGLGRFSGGFLDWLAELRFTGDVYAMPEGTPVFPHEPLLEVEAPIGQAQLIESFLMNQVHLQTLLASKASRVVTAARGRKVVDFAMRRMHGTDAALKGARAFYIAGVDATSNVLAGHLYGIPVSGTMAHSYVQATRRSSRAFARSCGSTRRRSFSSTPTIRSPGCARWSSSPGSWATTSPSGGSASTPATSARWRFRRGRFWTRRVSASRDLRQ